MNIDNRERFTLRIPESLFESLKSKSQELGISINARILQILWDWAEKEEKEKRGCERD